MPRVREGDVQISRAGVRLVWTRDLSDRFQIDAQLLPNVYAARGHRRAL